MPHHLRAVLLQNYWFTFSVYHCLGFMLKWFQKFVLLMLNNRTFSKRGLHITDLYWLVDCEP